MVADKLSRLGQTIQTEWTLLLEVFQAICKKWLQPQIDLSSTTNSQFVSPVPDQLAWAVDALSLLWEDLDTYAFPPAAILGKVLEKLQNYPYRRNHSECSWVAQPAVVLGSSDHVQPGPTVPAQPVQPAHSTIQSNSTQESIKPKYTSRSRASLRQWLRKLRTLKEDQPDQSMRQVLPQ